jgi:Domain of unknown function (DUF4864)
MAVLHGKLVSILGLFALAIAAPLGATAGERDVDARAVIMRQLDAVSRNAAAEAFELNAPGVKARFSDPGVFLAMVREKYQPIYRHRSVEFGATMELGGDLAQLVTIVDQDNQVWTASFRLVRQADGHWLVNGCYLEKSSERTS